MGHDFPMRWIAVLLLVQMPVTFAIMAWILDFPLLLWTGLGALFGVYQFGMMYWVTHRGPEAERQYRW